MGILDRWQKKTTGPRTEKKAEIAPDKVAKENKEVKKEMTKKTKVASILSNKIIVRPVVTEKATVMESQNKYAFYVDRRANKTQIKRAIKEIYGVAPIAVQTVNVEGKKTRFGRSMGRRSDYKKAFVTLPAGKTIMVHEGV